MGQLSEKELSVVNDLLADEELLTKKFKCLHSRQTTRKLNRNTNVFLSSIRDILILYILI
jgi:hypothetical protein